MGVNTHEAQTEVAQHVKDRGYRDGWTLEQFILRNVAKLQEELAEVSQTVVAPGPWLLDEAILRAGETARLTFDNKKVWRSDIDVLDVEALRGELADCQVVLLNLASAVEELSERHFDVVLEAVRKSKADVERGVR